MLTVHSGDVFACQMYSLAFSVIFFVHDSFFEFVNKQSLFSRKGGKNALGQFLKHFIVLTMIWEITANLLPVGIFYFFC